MKATTKLFYFYLKDSISEITNNFKLYSVYIIGLSLVSIAQSVIEVYFKITDPFIRGSSKVLFSIIPILILSKILYVIKIRSTGVGEYREVVFKFLLYNFYYVFFIILTLGFYFIPATILVTMTNSTTWFVMTSFLLIPCIYFMIYNSLSPYVAVFEEGTTISYFKESMRLSAHNIYLIAINHAFSTTTYLFYFFLLMIEKPNIRLATAVLLSVPESILSLVVTLTTSRIYFYLKDQD